MKKYIKSRILMTIEAIVIIGCMFMLNKSNNIVTVLSVASNTNLNKSVDLSVIQNTQSELFKEKDYNPVTTFVGELTGYAGDCPLCSGYLACPPRTNVLKEGIYYNDKTYGNIRIVASSKNYPCGTILRFNVNKLSEDPIIAIVLDRGVSGNVSDITNEEFEVLRKGWTK